MTERPIQTSEWDGVFEIILNRPEVRNALLSEHIEALGRVIDEAEASQARCLLLRGAGGAFCAGRDLGEIDVETEDAARTLREVINPVLLKLRRFRTPTVAAVRGPCLGLGFGLAFACDIVLAADDARMGSPFANIGLVLDSGGHRVLRDALGYHRAADLIFTGRLLDGRTAAAMGLVSRSMGGARVEPEARGLARRIARGPTRALQISKRILATEDMSWESLLDAEAEGQGEAMRTHDGKEGVAAFVDRRKPVFTGK